MKARHAAKGRRAHQMCNVEMWPWRMFFSRREWGGDLLQGESHFNEALASGLGGHGVSSLTAQLAAPC